MANETIRLPNDFGLVNGYGFSTLDFGVGKDYFGNPSGGLNGAVRFTNIGINKSQSINMAYLHLSYDNVGASGTWKWKLTGIDEDNTSIIDGSTWGRSRTTAEHNFNEGEPTSGGTKTLDVKSILEEITSRSGWSNGNAIGFTMTDEGSDSDVWVDFSPTNSYLVYRLSAEPNFKPTPKSVTAPALPTAESYGMKWAKPNQNVFTATDDELYYTSRKTQFKINAEGQFTNASLDTDLNHGLGYVPMVEVFYDSTGGGNWVRLPQGGIASTQPYYYVDSTKLRVHMPSTGNKIYYYVFLDKLAN